MSSKDMARNTEKLIGILPASYTGDITGAELDMTDSKGICEIIVLIGKVAAADAANFFEFQVVQSATSGGSFSAAGTDQYDPMGSWDRLINATTEEDAVQSMNFRLKPGFPFLKLFSEETLTAEAIFGAVVLKDTIVKPSTT